MDQKSYMEKSNEQLHLKVDDLFFWNYFATTELRNNRFDTFILPIMRGCIQVFTYLFNGILCRFELISRRSRHKAGTRYRMRGIDENGFVANYVETEQRIFSKKRWTSLVQTRGSIPLFWEQSGKGYRPTPRIIQNKPHVIFYLIYFYFLFNLFLFYFKFFFSFILFYINFYKHFQQKEAFEKHFDQQISKYKTQIIVNLLDSKGPENNITQAYENEIKECTKYKDSFIYYAFDFHSQCKNNQYQNVSILLQEMKDKISQMSYYLKGNLKIKK
jgi:hypothetical protein